MDKADVVVCARGGTALRHLPNSVAVVGDVCCRGVSVPQLLGIALPNQTFIEMLSFVVAATTPSFVPVYAHRPSGTICPRVAASPVAELSGRSVASIAALVTVPRWTAAAGAVGAVGAVAYIANEFKKRDDLVKSGEECMVGDEQACGLCKSPPPHARSCICRR